MQVRESVTSDNALISLTTENDGIVLDPPRGLITMYIDAEVMEDIPAGKYVYDLELIDGDGIVERLTMGSFTVRAEVTR